MVSQRNYTVCDGCRSSWPRLCRCGCGISVARHGARYAKSHDPKSRAKMSRTHKNMRAWHVEHAAKTIMTPSAKINARANALRGDAHPSKAVKWRRHHSEVMSAKGDAHHAKRADVRRKISESHKSRGEDHWTKKPEVRLKMSASAITWRRGHKKEAERRTKNLIRHRPKSVSAETRAKMSTARLALGDAHPSKRPEVRAKISAARSRQTHRQSGTEKRLASVLDGRVFKYAGTNIVQVGQPISADFVAPSVKLIVQVDGCYWHECPEHGSGHFPKAQARDASLTDFARKSGWEVVRIWQHEIEASQNSLNAAADRLAILVASMRAGKK